MGYGVVTQLLIFRIFVIFAFLAFFGVFRRFSRVLVAREDTPANNFRFRIEVGFRTIIGPSTKAAGSRRVELELIYLKKLNKGGSGGSPPSSFQPRRGNFFLEGFFL